MIFMRKKFIQKIEADNATGKFPASLKKCGLLDKYAPQENVGEEKVQKVGESKVREIKGKFREFLAWEYSVEKDKCRGVIVPEYRMALELIGGSQYTSEDIKVFSISLVLFQEEKDFPEKAGYFLSALVDSGKGMDFTVYTENLSVLVDCMGYRNWKNVRIHGNVGKGLGLMMERGRIMLQGNAGDNAGEGLGGGRVIIDGNVGREAGNEMCKGSLIVNGNAGRGLGENMQGGKIIVNGRISSLSGSMKGGDIFQYEQQVVLDGKVVYELSSIARAKGK